MTGFTTSAPLEIVREILFRRDVAARQTQPEGLTGERLDLRSVALESVRVKVLTHHGHGVLELCLEPGRGVGEALLGRGEAIVGGAERLGEALGDPLVRSQASRRMTIRCCGGNAPVLRKYSCSMWRKSGNRRAMD